jgi:sporulation protein YlmC with PRC-barrel domain
MVTLVAVKKGKDTGKVAQIDIKIKRDHLDTVLLRPVAVEVISNQNEL